MSDVAAGTRNAARTAADRAGGRSPRLGDGAHMLVTIAAGTYVYALAWLLLWMLVPLISQSWSPLVITTGSMSPAIVPGDVVLVDDASATIEDGTVVTFADRSRDRQLVTHRKIGERDGRLVTKGDANPDPDPLPVARSDVVGQGRLVLPRIGLPVLWMRTGRTPMVVAWVVLTVAAAVAVAPMPRSPGDAHGAPSHTGRSRR